MRLTGFAHGESAGAPDTVAHTKSPSAGQGRGLSSRPRRDNDAGMRGYPHPRTMTLRELMGNGAPEVEVWASPTRATSVTRDALFLRRPASGRRPRFRAQAVERGAVALVSQRPLGLGVPELVVPDVRAAMGPRRRALPGRSRRTRSTSWASPARTARRPRPSSSATMLEAAGRQDRAARHGQARGRRAWRSRSSARRPRRSTCRRPSARCSTPATRACAMEVPRTPSSWAASPASASPCRVFTNLTQDHLDFHQTMEDYFAAKRRLFERPGGPSS